MATLSHIRFGRGFNLLFAAEPHKMAMQAKRIAGDTDPQSVFERSSNNMQGTVWYEVILPKNIDLKDSKQPENSALICNLTINQDRKTVASFHLMDQETGQLKSLGKMTDFHHIDFLKNILAPHIDLERFPMQKLFKNICREVEAIMAHQMECKVLVEGDHVTIENPELAH